MSLELKLQCGAGLCVYFGLAENADYFRTQEVLNICIAASATKSLLIFSLGFLSDFIACLTGRELLTSDSSIHNFRQAVNFFIQLI